MLVKSPTTHSSSTPWRWSKKAIPRRRVELLKRVIRARSGNQCYAYLQSGQTHESTGDLEAGPIGLPQGIAAAGRAGDDHARGEIAAALEDAEE
jgi:hypothetical protein